MRCPSQRLIRREKNHTRGTSSLNTFRDPARISVIVAVAKRERDKFNDRHTCPNNVSISVHVQENFGPNSSCNELLIALRCQSC